MKTMPKLVNIVIGIVAASMLITACPDTNKNDDDGIPQLTSFRIDAVAAVLAASGSAPADAAAGTITLTIGAPGEIAVNRPVIETEGGGVLHYAVTSGAAPTAFYDIVYSLNNGDVLWIKNSSNGQTCYYKIAVTVSPYTPPDPLVIDEDDPFHGEVRGKLTKTFSMESLPTPAEWNTAGDMYEYPNPFVRMDGTQITDPLDWEAYEDQNGVRHPRPLNNKIPAGWTLVPGGRRAEIKKIAEYYHQGAMPPRPNFIDVTVDPGAAGGSTTIEMGYADSKGLHEATLTATLNMPDFAPNGKPPSPENKVPIFFAVGGAPAELRANGWATLVLRQSTDSTSGAVQSLFGYSDSDFDRPSNLMRIAWEASRWMDVAESGAWGDCVDASKSAVSGVSRNGKAAMVTGAFAESKKGTRIAISIPASSGGGGANMERWTHQKPTRAAAGYTKFGLKFLKNYAMTPESAYIAVKVPPKDWDVSWWPTGGSGSTYTSNDGRVAQRTQNQNLPSIRGENAGWVSRRMFSFTVQNGSFGLDPGGGVLSTMPMDTHFIAALSAPNIWMGSDGWNANSLAVLPSSGYNSGWVSQEPVYMTYLATREVYDFLGVEQNCGVILTMTGHAWPTNQVYAMIDYANWFFNKYHHPDAAPDDMYRRLSGEGAQPVHPVEVFTDRLKDSDGKAIPYNTWYNPMAMEDYLRLNWKNPNRTRQLPNEYTEDGITGGRSIAANVRAYFRDNPDELVDLNGSPVSIDYSQALVPEGN